MTGNHSNIDNVHIKAYIQSCPFVLKILSGNKILTSIKGHNSVINYEKITGNNPNLDLVNINALIKFGEIISICSRDIERKRKTDINQGP